MSGLFVPESLLVTLGAANGFSEEAVFDRFLFRKAATRSR